jgi:hypothetical protein
MGNNNDKEIVQPPSPKILKQNHFVDVDQDNQTMIDLLDTFINNNPSEALEIVKSINNGIVEYKEGSCFKGYITGNCIEKFHTDCRMSDQYNDYFKHSRNLYSMSIHNVKPLVLAYFYTVFHIYEKKEYIENRHKMGIIGETWIIVIKEMIKTSKFNVNVITDQIFGKPLINLMLESNVYFDSNDETSICRPFSYDHIVFEKLLSNVKLSVDMFKKCLLLDIEELKLVLEKCEYKHLFLEYNFLYFVERNTELSRGGIHYAYSLSFNKSRQIIKLLQKYGQSEDIKNSDENLYCHEFALSLKHYDTFLVYNSPITNTCIDFIKQIDKSIYERNKESINKIIKSLKSDEISSLCKHFISLRMYELANHLSKL